MGIAVEDVRLFKLELLLVVVVPCFWELEELVDLTEELLLAGADVEVCVDVSFVDLLEEVVDVDGECVIELV